MLNLFNSDYHSVVNNSIHNKKIEKEQKKEMTYFLHLFLLNRNEYYNPYILIKFPNTSHQNSHYCFSKNIN